MPGPGYVGITHHTHRRINSKTFKIAQAGTEIAEVFRVALKLADDCYQIEEHRSNYAPRRHLWLTDAITLLPEFMSLADAAAALNRWEAEQQAKGLHECSHDYPQTPPAFVLSANGPS